MAGALLGYFALSAAQEWVPRILAIAAAGMLYVAVADLMPGLHRRARLGETAAQVAFIGLGILTLWSVHHVARRGPLGDPRRAFLDTPSGAPQNGAENP